MPNWLMRDPEIPERKRIAVAFDDYLKILDNDVTYYLEADEWELVGTVPGNTVIYYQFQLRTRPP